MPLLFTDKPVGKDKRHAQDEHSAKHAACNGRGHNVPVVRIRCGCGSFEEACKGGQRLIVDSEKIDGGIASPAARGTAKAASTRKSRPSRLLIHARRQFQERARPERRPEQAARTHQTPNRNDKPPTAMAAPAVRTAKRPPGAPMSRPKAMPNRCKRPVARTKPIEYVIGLLADGSSVPCACP